MLLTASTVHHNTDVMTQLLLQTFKELKNINHYATILRARSGIANDYSGMKEMYKGNINK
jgi:hypothetical protein